MERSCVYPCLQQSLGRRPPTNRKVVVERRVERTTTLCIYCEPQNDGYRHAKRARMKYCCEVPLYFTLLQAVPIKSVFPNIKSCFPISFFSMFHLFPSGFPLNPVCPPGCSGVDMAWAITAWSPSFPLKPGFRNNEVRFDDMGGTSIFFILKSSRKSMGC